MTLEGRGTQPVTDGAAAKDTDSSAEKSVSALGGCFEDTPHGGADSGHLDSIRKLTRGDFYIGRGSRQRKLERSKVCNKVKVSEVGRTKATSSFRDALLGDSKLRETLWSLSGRTLVCRCQLSQPCHGNVLFEEIRRVFPDAHDRNDLKSSPPSDSMLDFMARLREEPDTESDSSPDKGVPGKRSWYCGRRTDVRRSQLHCVRDL